jgi:hypothetical protein
VLGPLVEVQLKILDIILLRKVYVVYADLGGGGEGAGSSSCGKSDVDKLGSVRRSYLDCVWVG